MIGDDCRSARKESQHARPGSTPKKSHGIEERITTRCCRRETGVSCASKCFFPPLILDASWIEVGADVLGAHQKSNGGDKNNETKEFVAEMRWLGMTPHLAQNTARRGGSAIDGRTTRHGRNAKPVNAHRGIEKFSCWIKQFDCLR